MNGHFITAALLGCMLVACGESHTSSSLTASRATEEQQSVVLLGYRISHQVVTFQVSSDECTSDSDYDVTWLESARSQIFLIRKAKSDCPGKSVVKEISFPAKEAYFTVANSVALDKSSYDCNGQLSNSSAKIWGERSFGGDIPRREESLNLAIHHQGCVEGTNLALTKWTETWGGFTGKKSRDIQTKNLCVKGFGSQAGILPGPGGITGVRIHAIEYGVIKSTEVTTDIQQKGSAKSVVLGCRAR